MKNLTEIVVQEALVEANDAAKMLIPEISRYGTNPFIPLGGVNKRKYALGLRFSYKEQPEIRQQLEEIAKTSLARSIQRNSGRIVVDEINKSLGKASGLQSKNI